MRTFKKYEFISEAEADTYLNQLPTLIEEGEIIDNHPHQIKKLGFLVKTPATFDENGNELTPTIFSDKYSVDVLWDYKASSPYITNWRDKEISNDGTWGNPNGAHTWFGFTFS